MRLTWGELDLTDYPFSVEFGSEVGAPQNEAETLASLLQDGEIELSSRASNRGLAFNVLIEGSDLAELASNEALLIAESERVLNTIALDPEDYAPVTVFEVFRGQVEFARDDNMESARLRRYAVSVRAFPFSRSKDEVVTLPLIAGTTTVSADDCSSATGWSGTIDGAASAPTVASGAVVVTSGSVPSATITLTRTGAIATSATPYIWVDWKPATTAASVLKAAADGVDLERIAQGASPTAGYTRTWFRSAAASVSVLALSSYTSSKPPWPGMPGAPAVRSLSITQVSRTDVRPVVGTARQQLRSIPVPGSARGRARVTVESETSNLGPTLLYFWQGGPDGYSPGLRQYQTAGPATADATTVSGSKSNIKGATATFEVPATRLAPGSHALVASIAGGAGEFVTLSWTAQTYLGGAAVGAAASGSRVVSIGDTFARRIVLGRRILPAIDLAENTAAVVRITMTAAGYNGDDPAAIDLDEAWLANLEIGQLTILDVPAKRLWLEPASLQTPRPTLRIGNLADGSDGRYAPNVSWQMPNLAPPLVNYYAVTTTATDAAVTVRGFPYWHTHAGS